MASIKKLDKLKRLTLDELQVRSAQKATAFAERRGWSALTKLPTDQTMLGMLSPTTLEGLDLRSANDCLERFRARDDPKFFAGFEDRTATLKELRQRWAKSLRNREFGVIEQANRILEGRFNLLGLRELSFGTPIDWHLEPVSGKRAPLLHWSQLNFLDAELAGDKKIIWELNRHQYFSILGQAYWITDDERYAETFVDHLNSWMDQNPPKLGINWASSLEVAFRSISWLWAFYFFKDAPSFTPSVFLRALKFLYLNGRHLESYLSTYFSPNTHLTGEALGLFYLGTLLPELKLAEHWRETGRRILTGQLPLHVRPDGTYFEQSSYYHRYTTDIYIHFLILARLNNGGNYEAESKLEEKLALLLDHLMYIQRPDGTTPLYGDDDGGRLMTVDHQAANDFRAPLSTGATLFGRGDYKYVAGEASRETLWLLGADALLSFDQLQSQTPEYQSIAFGAGGYYVMRDGWTTTANYLLFDCGAHGQDNCGHAHADALAFEVAANGRSLLVDPGTYTYTASRELRNWFRSSLAHNTLTVDRQSSSVPDGPFSWQTTAIVKPTSWITNERFDYVAGTHNGYARLPQPVAHQREILFLKQDYWIVRDKVESPGEHTVDVWFHFTSHTDPLIETHGKQSFIAEGPGETGLDVYAFAETGRWRREEGWVSHCYSQRDPSPVYAFSARLTTANVISFLVPRTVGVRSEIREIEATGGHAFESINQNCRDTVMIRTGDRVEIARLSSDFEWTWMRFSTRGDSLPDELLLLGGTTVLLDGSQMLKTPQKIEYLFGRRSGDEFRIETSVGIGDCQLPIGDLEAVFSKSKSSKTSR